MNEYIVPVTYLTMREVHVQADSGADAVRKALETMIRVQDNNRVVGTFGIDYDLLIEMSTSIKEENVAGIISAIEKVRKFELETLNIRQNDDKS